MKINFDELFSKTAPLEALPSALSYQAPAKNFKQQASLYKKQVSPRPRYVRSTNIDDMNEDQQLKSSSILQKLNKLTKMVQQKQQITKKQPKVNITELTNKLYQPALPKKKNCTKHAKPSPKEPSIPHNQIKNKAHYKSTGDFDCPRYVRLYHLNKINTIKNLYRAQSHRNDFQRQHSKEDYRTKTSESYLQNYVPFYDRLDSEVNRSLQKQKFYENNPQYSCGQLKQLFKPTTIPDKYKEKVECRYNKSARSTKNTNQLEQMLNSSLNTSFCSLDKSVEIVSRIEEHFFQKMKLIFINQSGEKVAINQHVVSMLTDVEFRILQHFIMGAQSDPIPNQDFEMRLREYYYRLPPNERLELRNHQTKKKSKTVQDTTSPQQPSMTSFRKKVPATSKYLKKVQSFI